MPADDRVYNVLFLCTGNSARSIVGEAILNHVGQGRFVQRRMITATPSTGLNPGLVEALTAANLPAPAAILGTRQASSICSSAALLSREI